VDTLSRKLRHTSKEKIERKYSKIKVRRLMAEVKSNLENEVMQIPKFEGYIFFYEDGLL